MDRPHARDQSVERLLRTSPRQTAEAGPTDQCLDAETMGAWLEDGLTGAALETAEAHVATCARCQAAMGAFVRATPAPVQVEPMRQPLRWLRWAVPITAAAAAVVLWIVVPREAYIRRLQTPADQTAADNVASAPATTVPTGSAAATAPASPPPALGEPEKRAEQPAQPPNAPAGTAKDGRVQAPAPAETGNLDTRDFKKEADSLEPPRTQMATPAAPAPSASPAPPAALAERKADRAAEAANAAPAAPAATARRLDRVGTAVGGEIVSPDPSVRWRIAGQSVERTTDGGGSWLETATGVAAELTAGAAPSATVCWMVGRAGVVLLSTDGRTWRRLPFPEVTDLSAVQATDARRASVSTSDGRTFTTTDGGASWTLSRPQEF